MDDSDEGEWRIGRLRLEQDAAERTWILDDVGAPLSEDDHTALVHAITAVNDDIEQETINFVQANSQTYVGRVLNVADDFGGYRDSAEWNPARRAASVLRVHFMNWLVSFRAYIDHKQTALSRQYGKESAQVHAFTAATSAAFDGSFAYRFAYRLRNYAQHVGFPPLYPDIREVLAEDGPRTLTEMFFARDELLTNFDGWGGRVGPEIAAMTEEFPADPIVLEAMDALQEVHRVVLGIDRPFLEEQMRLVANAIDRAPGEKGTIVLAKLERDTGGKASGFQIRAVPDVSSAKSEHEAETTGSSDSA